MMTGKPESTSGKDQAAVTYATSDEGKYEVQRAGDQEMTGKLESTSGKDKAAVTYATSDEGYPRCSAPGTRR